MALPAQIGAYRLSAELGRGAMGVVYRGQAPDGGEVAIKVLNPANLSETGAARFEREARLSQELVHPNLIRVYESGLFRGQRYLVMEWVPGVSLEETLRQGPLPTQEVRDLGQALCAGLAAAHARGILHRDLKPANVLMGGGRIVLTDFGLALDASEDRERLTRTGVLLGSPAYMAPEQVEGKSPLVGPRTDVYGLGATLYEAMTGQPPFSAPSLLEVVVKVVEGGPLSPLKLNPGADPHLAEVCLRCMASDPADRYDSVEEVAGELEPRRARPKRGRGLVGAGLALLVLVSILGWVARGPSPGGVQSESTPSPKASPGASPSLSLTSAPSPDGRSLAARGDIPGALAALGQGPEDLALRAELLFWRSSNLYFERNNRSRLVIKDALRANPSDPLLAALHHHAWRSALQLEGAPSQPKEGAARALWTAWDLAAYRSRDLDHIRRIYLAFERAHELDPQSRWAHLGRLRYSGDLARLTQTRADFERARGLAQIAHEAWPLDSILTWRLAWTFKIEGEVLIKDSRSRDRALDLLGRALELMNEVYEREPRWAHISLARGYTKFLISRLTGSVETAEGSLSDLERATKLRPGDSHAHYTLGLVRQSLGLKDPAAQAYREAIRKDPHVVSYYLRLTTLYLEQERVEEARRLLSSAVALPTLSAKDRATLRRTLEELPVR